MPSYVLPKLKKSKQNTHSEPEVEGSWARRISLPADKKILKSLELDTEVEVLVKARIIGLEDVANADGHDRTSVDLELISYEVYDSDDNEFTKLSDD